MILSFFDNWQQLFLACVVFFVFLAFIREWVSAELVALSALFICVLSGILSLDAQSPYNALRVFSHPAPITVACMFVLSAALEYTGVIEFLGRVFEKMAGKNPLRILLVMMGLVTCLSAFVNNTPVVVIFIPIVLALCRKRELTASKYLIPLSYASIVGGTTTLIGTSTNLIAVGIAQKHHITGLGMFTITPLGLIFVGTTFLYILLVGRKLLPKRLTLATLIDSENTREFLTHAFVKKGSDLDGASFEQSILSRIKKARIIEILRDGRRLRRPLNALTFEAGDEIVFKGNLDAVMGLHSTEGIALRGDEASLEGVRTESAMLMEGMLGPDSPMMGKSLKQLNFRQRYGVVVLAVHRRGRNLNERFEDEKLALGDTLLVQGSREKMRTLFEDRAFINLSEPKQQKKRIHKAPIALGALLLFIFMGALGGHWGIPSFPVVGVALGVTLLVLLTGCIEPQDAYRAIDWKVIFMIFGMLGLGMGMEHTGLVYRLAEGLTVGLKITNPRVILLLLYLLATLLTEMISNNAVAVLLTPIAIVLSQSIGASPLPFIIAVMFGASASFATPIGYQTNTFVYGAGGYRFSDFLKVGLPLNVLFWVISSLIIPVLWPF